MAVSKRQPKQPSPHGAPRTRATVGMEALLGWLWACCWPPEAPPEPLPQVQLDVRVCMCRQTDITTMSVKANTQRHCAN